MFFVLLGLESILLPMCDTDIISLHHNEGPIYVYHKLVFFFELTI